MLGIDDGWVVSHEQSNMSHKLVFPRKGSATGALPLEIPTVLLMCPQVRKHRELLLVAPLAHIHFGAVASLVMILSANHWLQWLELGMLLVPPTPFLRAWVFLLVLHTTTHQITLTSPNNTLNWVTQCSIGLVLIPMSPHVHPQIRITLEPFATNLAIMCVLSQQILSIQFNYIIMIILIPFIIIRFIFPSLTIIGFTNSNALNITIVIIVVVIALTKPI